MFATRIVKQGSKYIVVADVVVKRFVTRSYCRENNCWIEEESLRAFMDVVKPFAEEVEMWMERYGWVCKTRNNWRRPCNNMPEWFRLRASYVAKGPTMTGAIIIEGDNGLKAIVVKNNEGILIYTDTCLAPFYIWKVVRAIRRGHTFFFTIPVISTGTESRKKEDVQKHQSLMESDKQVKVYIDR